MQAISSTFRGHKLVGTTGRRTGRPSQARALRVYAAANEVTLLDYGAGNVRSVRNALHALGYTVHDVTDPRDILKAEKLIFPGVGSYGSAMDVLKSRGYVEPLREYLLGTDKAFFGVCLGMQLLFEGSEENGGVEGLGVIPGQVTSFPTDDVALPVPHMGWNGVKLTKPNGVFDVLRNQHVYFVHSFHASPNDENEDWVAATCNYGRDFVAAVSKDNKFATQFHPEKSGVVGISLLRKFLQQIDGVGATHDDEQQLELVGIYKEAPEGAADRLAKRVIACLDVRSNDQGDLVVTKGDQYDVREATEENEVRNLGKPVELAGRYFQEGADEVTFLNITGFRDFPLGDMPMLEVLRATSEKVFVPLTVGGGIRDFTDSRGRSYSSLEVAAEYFRSGADKVSIGSDAVFAAEEYLRTGVKTGKTSIEQISTVYGKQAVVISVDPKRVYEKSPDDTPNKTLKASVTGPNGEEYVWYQCTVKGGRETRPIGAYELATACEALGAGEILLNCIDKDGSNNGFELDLVKMVKEGVRIPVIASSGAGAPEHFTEVFNSTDCSAALAAGIFHRREVPVGAVKEELVAQEIPTRW
mmetsp:Transcript_3043/g.10952  ORF Transcript_3043/g.10952 Transcript_3043/m.10952 type:complete len:585 (-) Transcript_3043:64-1818(-)